MCKPKPTEPAPAWKFSDIIADEEIRARWEKVRKYFFLRESTYDMTRRCNIRCQGYYYYEGDKQHTVDNSDPEDWRQLMLAEKARGITYVVLAGAEPSLVPELLQVCYDNIRWGAIATNGMRKIDAAVGYRIHISVWGNDETSQRVRRAENMLERQIDNYCGDPRAVFVYTYTSENIAESREVVAQLAAQDCAVTFNVFSAPVGYTGPLRHTPKTLAQTRDTMLALMDAHPQHVLYAHTNVVAHTSASGLHDLYGCSYPRRNPSQAIGLGRSFKQYRSDLTWDREAACCVPDTDCPDCRHYAAGSAIVTARLFRHAVDPLTFRAWLDYVDTYLAVWVTGYTRGPALCHQLVPPPVREPSRSGEMRS